MALLRRCKVENVIAAARTERRRIIVGAAAGLDPKRKIREARRELAAVRIVVGDVARLRHVIYDERGIRRGQPVKKGARPDRGVVAYAARARRGVDGDDDVLLERAERGCGGEQDTERSGGEGGRRHFAD